MINLSQKNTLIYSFVLMAIVILLLGLLLGYFLFYHIEKTKSAPERQVKSTILEIDEEILNLNSNNLKGGDEG